MRVLLVNGFAAASASGRARYDEFRQHVLRVMKEIERQDVTQIDIIEKSRQDLDEFLFEMHSEFAEPGCITNFDRLDFVFAVGDASASPWAPPLRKLVLLVKMCMMTGKCFYGSGLGASVLAFLCSTAGENLRVLNNHGKGSLLADVQAVPPPPPAVSETVVGHSAAKSVDVLLDTRSGDFFTFDGTSHAWVPRGNTGLMHHTSDHAHDYGARVNTARAGTKTHRAKELGQALYASKRGDLKCCVRLEATGHALVAVLPREFLANCKSCWDLDEQINATGNNKYRVLVDSHRGPVLVEFGNCVGAHFALAAREYPESAALVRNFVLAKYEFLKVHEHLDRSYVSAIAGSARLKQRLQLAATKTSVAVSASASSTHGSHPTSHTTLGAATMTSGRTSPKRCRPVSAGPYRSPSRHAEPGRTIQTSRSEYPSQRMTATVPAADQPVGNNQWDESRSSIATRPSRPQTARASLRVVATKSHKQDDQPETESPRVEDETQAFVSPRVAPKVPIKAHRRIRVAQRNELDKPYCAIDRFNALHEAEKAQHKDLYYSVVNDAPYASAADRELLAAQQSKLKWVAGPFRTAVGKASTQPPAPEVSNFARVPFDQRNVPFHIIQRRQLDPPSPPSSRRHVAGDVSQPTRPHVGNTPRKRPASAAAATRRPQR